MTTLPLGEKISFEMEVSLVTPVGQNAIGTFIRNTHFPTNPWQFYFPDEWNWNWLETEKGEYVGKLPVRVSKYLQVNYGVRLAPEQISEIGNLARQNMVTTDKYLFDFDQQFDWHAGDFGDGGSCYWGDHAGARDMLRDHDAYAIRFYDPGWSTKGIARAWIIPWESDTFILYNGYGYDTFTVASVLTSYLGLRSRRIEFANDGSSCGTLYINSGAAFLIGDWSAIQDIDEIDLDWEEIGITCSNCGDRVDEDDVCYLPNDEMVCRYCFDVRCVYCHNCEEAEWRNDAVEVEGRRSYWYSQNTYYYCRDCADNADIASCGHCGTYHFTDDMTYADDTSEYYCSDCAERHCWTCDDCGETFADQTANHTANGKDVCNSCLSEYYTLCNKCNDWYPNDALSEDGRCEDCVDVPVYA